MVLQQIFVMFCIGKRGLALCQFGHRFTSSLCFPDTFRCRKLDAPIFFVQTVIFCLQFVVEIVFSFQTVF